MWALDFLFLFLLIQLAARVDSSGEHQGSACVIYLSPSTHWWWNKLGRRYMDKGAASYWLIWLHSWTEARMEL